MRLVVEAEDQIQSSLTLCEAESQRLYISIPAVEFDNLAYSEVRH